MPSLQFVITDRMSLISPLNSNDRSIPLMMMMMMAIWAMALTKEIEDESLIEFFLVRWRVCPGCSRLHGRDCWAQDQRSAGQPHAGQPERIHGKVFYVVCAFFFIKMAGYFVCCRLVAVLLYTQKYPPFSHKYTLTVYINPGISPPPFPALVSWNTERAG